MPEQLHFFSYTGRAGTSSGRRSPSRRYPGCASTSPARTGRTGTWSSSWTTATASSWRRRSPAASARTWWRAASSRISEGRWPSVAGTSPAGGEQRGLTKLAQHVTIILYFTIYAGLQGLGRSCSGAFVCTGSGGGSHTEPVQDHVPGIISIEKH